MIIWTAGPPSFIPKALAPDEATRKAAVLFGKYGDSAGAKPRRSPLGDRRDRAAGRTFCLAGRASQPGGGRDSCPLSGPRNWREYRHLLHRRCRHTTAPAGIVTGGVVPAVRAGFNRRGRNGRSSATRCSPSFAPTVGKAARLALFAPSNRVESHNCTRHRRPKHGNR